MKKLFLPLLLLYITESRGQTVIKVPDNAGILSEIRQNTSGTNIVGSKVRLVHALTEADGDRGTDSRGGSNWKLAFDASAATDGIIVYFDELKMPDGATIGVSAGDEEAPRVSFGPQATGIATAYALPAVSGPHAVVTVHLPKGTEQTLSVRISEIGCLVSPRTGAANGRGTGIGFGQSAPCFANVACPEGAGYGQASRAVARYLFPSGSTISACSGSLVNTTNGACKDYFLSAAHCLINSTATEQAQTVFYFNYQSPNCATPGSEAGLNTQTVTGCQVRAISGTPGSMAYGSDFALLELNPIPLSYNVYYAGWDRTSSSATRRDSGAIIQHPWGDLKKISLYDTVRTSGTLIGVRHYQTANSKASNSPGSSGSPMFNRRQRIIGTVSEGSDCLNNGRGGSSGGTMAGHWDQNGAAANKRLAPWLDAAGTGALTVDGREACGGTPPTAVSGMAASGSGGLQVFPLPAHRQVQVTRIGAWSGGKASASLISLTGAVLATYSLSEGSAPAVLDIQAYPAGVYVLRVNGEGWAWVQRIVKE